MTIISSQRFLDESIVEEKIEELNGCESVTVPIAYAGEFEGKECYLLMDSHHTVAAAKEKQIVIEYEEQTPNDWNPDWTFEEILENSWNDSDWYDVETGIDVW